MQDINGEEYIYLIFKVLVVGDIGTGKTSIIKRYVHDVFSQNYKSTIGVDFALKNIDYNENTNIKLQLWDIAGQERFSNMTRVYYKEAVAAVVVFDITRKSTYDAISKWKNDIDSKVFLESNGEKIPTILFGNKSDLIGEDNIYVTEEEIRKYCIDNGFNGFYFTSAREKTGIEEGFNFLVEKIIDNLPCSVINRKSDTIKLKNNTVVEKKTGCCI